MQKNIWQKVRTNYWKVRLSFLFVGPALLLMGTCLMFLDVCPPCPGQEVHLGHPWPVALGHPGDEFNEHQDLHNVGELPAMFIVNLSTWSPWLGGVSIVAGLLLLAFSFVIGGGTKLLESRLENPIDT